MASKAFCEHGDDAYSYATCIRTRADDGVRFILNRTKYSPTTSRHQSEAFGHLDFEKHINLFDVPRGATASDLRKLAEGVR